MNYVFIVLLSVAFTCSLEAGRAVFRTKDPNTPTLHVSWAADTTSHILQDSHLEEWPLFHTFDREYFERHMLPREKISYRYEPNHSIDGATLSNLIKTALDEIHENQKTFTHFYVLKKRDFHKKTGLIVLKFKDYPFVVKLFSETPESFVVPCDKGFESTCFFYMGGGMNRHLAGFTRIKNLEHLQNKIAQHRYWHDKVSFPRKWFWTPENTPWLHLRGKNIGSGTPTTQIPSIYAVIADYIEIERTFTLQERKDRRRAFALSSYLHSSIDSHINNYVEEKRTNHIVILDTEHFPTLVGLRHEPPTQGYLQWYTHLAAKMAHDVFWRSKQERYAVQQAGPSEMHIAVVKDVL